VVLPNSAFGFAGSGCWPWTYLQVFVGFWSLLLLDWIPGVLDFYWSIVWLGFDWVNDGIIYKLSFGLGLLDSGSVWFGFSWFGLKYFASSFCFPCLDLFSWLGVQGCHSFEPIYWLFALGDLFALLLTSPQTLVSCSSCLPRLL